MNITKFVHFAVDGHLSWFCFSAYGRLFCRDPYTCLLSHVPLRFPEIYLDVKWLRLRRCASWHSHAESKHLSRVVVPVYTLTSVPIDPYHPNKPCHLLPSNLTPAWPYISRSWIGHFDFLCLFKACVDFWTGPFVFVSFSELVGVWRTSWTGGLAAGVRCRHPLALCSCLVTLFCCFWWQKFLILNR